MDTKRQSKRLPWWRRFVTVGGLACLLALGGSWWLSSTAKQIAPINSATSTIVAHAADKKSDSDKKSNSDSSKDKDNDKDSSSSSSDSSSSGNSSSGSSSASSSAWNSALSSLSQSVTSSTASTSKTKPSNSKSAEQQQAVLDDVVKNGNELNAWGFMGNGNSHIWEKQNNSSWTVSYNSLYSAGPSGNSAAAIADKNESSAYKQSARFAYALQASGLDQPVKAGFASTNFITQIAGWLMQLSYFVLGSAESLFVIALKILQSINPINWALYGAGSSNAAFAGLANTVHKLYGLMQGLGWAICGLILAGSIALAGMGISVGVGDAHVGPGMALLNVLTNLLKRFFVWIMLPIFGLAFFSATIDNVQGAFETQQNSVPNYAVYGSLIDFNDWAMNSRLGLPTNVKLPTSFDSKKLPSLTHNQILAINYKGAGVLNLKGLMSTNSNRAALKNSTSSANKKLNFQAQSLLKSWTSGATITAADYASVADASLRNAITSQQSKGAKASKNASASPVNASAITNALVQKQYNDNNNNKVTGDSASDYVYGTSNVSAGSKSSNGIANPLSVTDKKNGGLSTLGMYAYMLTTASDSQMSIADTENLSNDVSEPEHKSAILVGTGIESTGNLVWAFGMMVGLALLVVGYLLEVLKTIIQSLPAITMSLFQTGLMSLKGGVQFISVLAGLFIGVFGSAVMYLFAQMAFISVSSVSDRFISSKLMSTLVTTVGLHGNSSVGTLASTATVSATQSALNIAYGVLLLWLAVLLLRYRGVVCSSLGSLVEETANKIMATFGSLSHQGSAGTRGAISQNANTSNTIANSASNLARQAGTGALLAGGLGGASSLAKNGGGLSSLFHGANNTKQGKDSQKQSNNKDNARQNNRQSKNSSSNRDRQGNASERLNSMMPQNSDVGNHNGNQLSDPSHTQAGSQSDKATNMDHSLEKDGMQAPQADANGNSLSDLSAPAAATSPALAGEPGSIGMSDASQNASATADGQQPGNTDGLSNSSSDNLDHENAGLGSAQSNSLSNSQNSNGLSDAKTPAQATKAAQQQQQQLGQALGVTGSTSGLGAKASANQTLGNSTTGSLSNALSGHANTPVNSDMTPAKVQSHMSDVQNAANKAQNANQLAQAAPDNQTLAQSAQSANDQLSSLQSGAMADYNQQSLGDSALRSNWAGDSAKSSSLSVGSADHAMNSVYQAQSKASQAASQYGPRSTQAVAANQALSSARRSAVASGLSSSFVSDPAAISTAHSQASQDISNVMNGSWRSTPSSVSKIGTASHDSIGI